MVHFQIHKLYRDRNIDVFETVSIEELDPLRDESFYPNYRHVTPEFEQRRNRLNENPIAIVNRIFLTLLPCQTSLESFARSDLYASYIANKSRRAKSIE